MATSIDKLTKKEWSRLKKAAGIEKNQKLLKSDASVGKYVATFEKIGSAYKKGVTQKTLVGYIKAAEELKVALEKFMAAKDMSKDEANALKKDITGWISALDTRIKGLRKAITHPKIRELLAANDVKQVTGALGTAGLW